MFSRWAACAVAICVLGACGSDSHDDLPDAGPVINKHVVPISVSGTTPLGSLDRFPFAEASYDNCEGRFELNLTTTTFYDQEPRIEIWFRIPEDTAAPVTGAVDANAAAVQWDRNTGWTVTSYVEVTFDAAPLDPPLSSGRMTGTITTTTPGWMLDFYIDLTFYQQAPNHGGCTL